MGKLEDLEKLQYLKESGALTDEEFEMEKRIILNDTLQNTSNKVNKQVKPKIKLKVKKKQILCIIGIISLLLVGLYGATKNPIIKLITQHKFDSSISSSANKKETQNKTKVQKIQLNYNDLNLAISNTKTLELNYKWKYTETGHVMNFYGANDEPVSAEKNSIYKNNKNVDKNNIYIGSIKLSKMTDSNANVLMENVSSLAFRESPTGGKYDLIVGTVDDGISTLYSHKHKDYETYEIIAVLPGFNMERNDKGIVTSISYCSRIVDDKHISYKSFPYEEFLQIKKEIVQIEEKFVQQTGISRYGDDIDYTIDGWYSPQYNSWIDIQEIMKELNYKTSEYDIEEDFTEEIKNTDIEFYSVQEDGSLNLEYTSTGIITTIKFN